MINNIKEQAQAAKEMGRTWAQIATTERLLNAYLRETGKFDPILQPDDPKCKCLPSSILDEISRQGTPMSVALESTGVIIFGAFTYFSVFGHHRYGFSFWIKHLQCGDLLQVQSCKELAEVLLNELASSANISPQQTDLKETLLFQLENSLEKTSTYVERSFREGQSLWNLAAEERFYSAEQSLVYGHPFHPAPKSSQGFSAEDLLQYAPEMGASFVLNYFACAPEIIQESFLHTEKLDPSWFSPKVIEAVKQHLGPSWQQYRLIPCHPWQAEHLKKWPEVQNLLDTGRLVDLGLLGDRVYPTSSVRTVWDPQHKYFFKLPLNVRITNFIRVNPLEQLERTMDASRVLRYLSEQLPFSEFTILHEEGYRTLAPDSVTPEQRERLAESFGFIVRENPTASPDNKEVPLVVASLLEQPPHANEPPIIEAVRMAACQYPDLNQGEFLENWLKQYLDISLVPLLWLFIEHGVSIEAHVQNSIVALRDGWPVHFYVRDLEGVSIGHKRAREQAMFNHRIAEQSPVLYTEEEAWDRFKYYVVVNHLGHLIHTLAYYGSTDEMALWKVVAEVVQTSSLLQKSVNSSYLLDLIENEGLPAKANFISCFHQRGERPLYVTIPNPLITFRGKV
ncbi:IucA/IucC family protein [Paenibacillus sp. BR2-3]|uniref:IucA/IucC family protein n=1 Tax=Paenibacillus sp. BR2-3 TaxID=3048494 RepID=UPI0039777F65